MRKRSGFQLLLVAGMLMSQHALGQQAVTAAGGNATGSGGSVSYSVGQPACATYSNLNGSVAEGVQQPFEIYQYTATEDPSLVPTGYWVYPNPTGNNLTLKSERPLNQVNGKPCYQLTDFTGRLLLGGEVNGTETTLPTACLAAGVYLLRIKEGDTQIITFNIIKQ